MPTPRQTRVLAVFAHPDDETWAAGGLLRRLSDAGSSVRLVTLTRGEAGFDKQGRRRGDALGAVRVRELEAALGALGVASFEVLGLPDLGVTARTTEAHIAPIVAALAPDLIVGMDGDGGYAHVDHVAAVRGTLAALAALPTPPCVLAATFAAGLFEPLRDRLAGRYPAFVHPDFAIGALGCAAPELVLRLSPSEAAAKRRALAAHASQLGPEGPDAFLFPGFFAAVAAVERYRHVLGPPPRASWLAESDARESA